MNRPAYPVLQEQDGRFVDVEFDRDFRFADAHVAVGAGRVQDTRDKKLLPEVGTLVQEDLEGKRQHSGRVNNRKRSVRREEHHDGGAKEPRLPDATVGPDLTLTLKGGSVQKLGCFWATHTQHQCRVPTGSSPSARGGRYRPSEKI